MIVEILFKVKYIFSIDNIHKKILIIIVFLIGHLLIKIKSKKNLLIYNWNKEISKLLSKIYYLIIRNNKIIKFQKKISVSLIKYKISIYHTKIKKEIWYF